jgi:hypothetical protein
LNKRNVDTSPNENDAAQVADASYATALALEFFSGRKLHRMLGAPAMIFVAKEPGKKDLEADFALFWPTLDLG